MDGLHALTAAGWHETIDEVEYYMEPLTLKDWGTIEKHLLAGRRDPIEVARENLEGLSPEEQRMLLEAALDRAIGAHGVAADELIAYTATPQGMAMMFWLSIRKRHPEIGEDRAAELLGSLGKDELARLRADIEGRGGIPEDPSKK